MHTPRELLQDIKRAAYDAKVREMQNKADCAEALELANHPAPPWTPEGSLRTHPCGACGARSLAGCRFPDSCPIERT